MSLPKNYRRLQQARLTDSPSRRSSGNIEVDPALAQELVHAACQRNPETEEYECPLCGEADNSPHTIKHEETCPAGHLLKRAHFRLEGAN